MPNFVDGPSTTNFSPIPLNGDTLVKTLSKARISKQMKEALPHALDGQCVAHGIPFAIKKALLLTKTDVQVTCPKTNAGWFVFMHTTDMVPVDWSSFPEASTRGTGLLNEHVANYVVLYEDGTEQSIDIRRRHHIGMFSRMWGENGLQCVAHPKPITIPPQHEQQTRYAWGQTQNRATANDGKPWINWLYAWQNPCPDKAVVGFRFEPKNGTTVLSAISAGDASDNPVRWQSRRKAVLKLPKGVSFDKTWTDGRLKQIELDMGTIISAQPRTIYPNDEWSKTYANKVPQVSQNEVLIEYTSHPDACFHVGGTVIPVAKLEAGKPAGMLRPINPSRQSVAIKVVEKGSTKPVPCKLHVHGEEGEYLTPIDRHRIPNYAWFEDYAPEFAHLNTHFSTYINGDTVMNLPLGNIYIEVTKGFEIKPVRKVMKVTERTKEITITLDKVLPWREAGWVTADTHVHFLSPQTAWIEGAGEGVNVVNLLASQWGELMTNIGDFDGKTTVGSKEAGGDGEYLVRVGTENRQHIMGHISLLGYEGNVIAPMTTGGPDESALGDPIDVLLTEWAMQCKEKGGLVVIPHFPNPRAEHAATIISGNADGIETTSWGNLYMGISAYALSDWYRYLNCGYFVPAVAGTDKMSANTAVGTVRTYAKVPKSRAFDYQAWMDAVRSGNTFVSYGPLIEFAVDGKPAGKMIKMSKNGGTVDVTWNVASVTTPMTSVELVVNGEVVQGKKVGAKKGEGHFSVKVDRSSWMALLVRGHYKDKPEVIAAHTSPVMVKVAGTDFFAAADALTILEQIEGALAYFDTIGTRAETAAYKRMRLVLTSAHREIHNRMHQNGDYHEHTHAADHKEHH